MAQHTPGPWFLEGKWTPGLGRLGGWVSSNPPAGSPVFELRPVVGDQETIIANARLIAAAPDLLAYVRRCASNCAEANELLKRVEGQS